MTNIVKHPETGLPVLEQTSYVELDRTQLEADVQAAQTALDALQAQLAGAHEQVTSLTEQHSQAEAALTDKKSLVDQFDAIQPAPDAGAEGDGGEVASPEAVGDTTEPAGEPAGDSGTGDASVATVVPVQVETPADEY